MISPSLLQIWFAHLCRRLPAMHMGAVYLGEADQGPYTLAVKSDCFDESAVMLDNVHAVSHRRKSIVTRVKANNDMQDAVANANPSVASIESKNLLVSSPVFINKQLVGVVCFVCGDDRSNNHDLLNTVEDAVSWLQLISQSETIPEQTPQNAALALTIIATALSQQTASAAAISVVTELANKLSCERVSLGFNVGHEVRMYAISHGARYERKQNLIKRIEAAMQEAIDQKETLVHPALTDSHYLSRAQANLARNHATDYVCSIPLVIDNKVKGCITLERSAEANEFSKETVELCEQILLLLAPILEYRRLAERSFLEKLKDSYDAFASDLAGTSHHGFKTGTVAGLLLFVFLFFMQWDYRIAADAVLEGAIERVITAPESGYIKEAKARPGDMVAVDQIMALLDDRDLVLEKLKWRGKRIQVTKEYREALASHDRSRIGILRAQLQQAEAQLEIINKKLQRTQISAPIAGYVVSGDFTRALGSPVEKGQVLYKVSPLDNYRVVLKVDETEISELTEGMQGELTLSAAAEDTYKIVINKITPVSIAEDGINYFQVEASLLSPPEFTRPGMQGVAKINIGQRQLLWIWTHKMVDWMRLQLWAWW